MATLPEIPVRSLPPPVHSPERRAVGPLGTFGSGSSWPSGCSASGCSASQPSDAALCCGGQDEILYMGFDGTKVGLPKDFVLTDYSKVRARSPRSSAPATSLQPALTVAARARS